MQIAILVISAVLVAYHTLWSLLELFDSTTSSELPPIMGYPLSSAIFIISLWEINLPLAIILLSVLSLFNFVRIWMVLSNN